VRRGASLSGSTLRGGESVRLGRKAASVPFDFAGDFCIFVFGIAWDALTGWAPPRVLEWVGTSFVRRCRALQCDDAWAVSGVVMRATPTRNK
jgi:hypothetical protein